MSFFSVMVRETLQKMVELDEQWTKERREFLAPTRQGYVDPKVIHRKYPWPELRGDVWGWGWDMTTTLDGRTRQALRVLRREIGVPFDFQRLTWDRLLGEAGIAHRWSERVLKEPVVGGVRLILQPSPAQRAAWKRLAVEEELEKAQRLWTAGDRSQALQSRLVGLDKALMQMGG